MEFRKYDEATGANLRGPIEPGDLPDGWALVGQFSKPTPQLIAPTTPTEIGFGVVNIRPITDDAAYTLFPFSFKPKRAGFYFVHCQRFEKIYGPTGGGYWVSLKIVDSFVSGVDSSEVLDIGVAVGGSTFDISKESLSAVVYCDGDTDEIRFTIDHNYSASLNFGGAVALNGKSHCSIFYIGPRKPLEGTAEIVGAAALVATGTVEGSTYPGRAEIVAGASLSASGSIGVPL